MPDLSVIIPARQEMFLSRTIEDVLKHAKADTEVIAVLDGAWADPQIADHPKVTLIHLTTSIGQRATTNMAARVSRSKYIMKLDAHCSVAEGFDRELISTAGVVGPTVVQVPKQYNFHVYDWVCAACDKRYDQAPHIKECPQCKGPVTMDIVWEPRSRHLTTGWSFDSDLQFQYDGGIEKRQKGKELPETMSCLGACWFMSRHQYWKLGGMDEAHGSWGQMGTEIGCKAWLSGGQLLTNTRTWFSHMFRVGGIGFPYPMHASDQEKARKYSRKMWRNNEWKRQIHPLPWLLDRFWPVKGWSDEARAALKD